MAAKILTLALTGLAIAVPLSSSSNAPCLSADFSMAMRIGVGEEAPYVSLTAIDSGKSGVLNIVGEKLERYRGTPAYEDGKGASGHASIGFDVTHSDDCETTQTGKFGIYVPDLGEEYGRSEPIYATKNTSWPHFYVSDGYINPQLTAASQQWYACNITVQGEGYWGLSFGVYNSNGSSPYGCVPTTVKQNFNIPCGF